MSLLHRFSRQSILFPGRLKNNSLLFTKSHDFINNVGYIRLLSSSENQGPPSNNKNFSDGKPTIEYAKKMETSYTSMTNVDILHLSASGDPGAREEALIRNIMVADGIPYDDALKIFQKIDEANDRLMAIHEIPYQVGLGVSLAAGAASLPLVFQFDSVLWLHDVFISEEIPEPANRETFLEIGSWSWAWMEPVLGELSFLLLTLQFARAQLLNMGLKPYGGIVKGWRAKTLIKKYPKYDPKILKNFVDTDLRN